MSDISVSDEPFVVRDAGHKGKGCFASRDIKAGETVLATYTPIVWKDGNRDWDRRVDTFIDLYDNLEEHEKQEWAALNSRHSCGAVERYNESLTRQRPDGSYLTEEQRRRFISLFLAADTNSFETADFNMNGRADDREDSVALFLKASRFNHSCDPNVTYICYTKRNRWVGRATRDIAKGEELFISYVPTHDLRKDRLVMTNQAWNFNCDCAKCGERLDTYTASLQTARDLATGVGGGRSRPPTYEDDADAMARQVHDRIELLKRIVSQGGETYEDQCRRRELTFAVWDAAVFHRNWFLYWRDRGAQKSEEAIKHLGLDRDCCVEALEAARAAWPVGHEIIKTLETDLRVAGLLWENTHAANDSSGESTSGDSASEDDDTVEIETGAARPGALGAGHS
ncbi:hypothetical protein F5Y14DRAFT_450588 [Nemania sp. NC0429]|nr:hypothetical protein F5Y14DRAFT_450588 [Nemania sp. NC0429]